MEKQTYILPSIEIIVLDNEISLALASDPPAGPEETFNNSRTPFKDEVNIA